MRVLSLFDGMSCAMLAMLDAGLPVERYVAYEIDKFAVQTSKHNYPQIEHRGDVFDADFSEYKGFDILMGGSPCTYWSIAQNADKRETTASGLGWELFCQYTRALQEAKPTYFVYENNKSMSKEIRESISEAFGFEPICINSALVSAQTRKRLYWVGKLGGDGKYHQMQIQQPADRGVVLRDILEGGAETWMDKSHAVTATEQKSDGLQNVLEKKRRTQVAVRVGTLPTNDGKLTSSIQYRIYSPDGKGVSLKANGGGLGANTGLYAIPANDGISAPPPPMRVKEGTKLGYVDIQPGKCVNLTMPNSKTRSGRSMEDKSNCLPTYCEFYQYCGTLDTPIYEVKDGCIAVNGKLYPIKLKNGRYIVRKLTVRECARLQTVPEWYEFPVSNRQAYKLIGNGWTVKVVAHLLEAVKEDYYGNSEEG